MKGEYRGYKYELKRSTLSVIGDYYCGYVSIPKWHKYYGVDYDEIPIDCHGELTYGKKIDESYIIGFDCAHLDDNIQIQNEAYCVLECESIIDQLIEAE